ncbi:MAG: crossover junction endodeoxyribonuclease RuvC [Bacteroidales bacterium]|nr:crossover junction endodeoxyribonuclease RuvC [Bacteroidales bacterium]
MKTPQAPLDKIILGIDPGTNVLGYGVLHIQGRRVEVKALGVIDLRRCKDVYLKLGRIYEQVTKLLQEFLPDEVSIEAPFFGKNVQSMLKLGRAQGVAIAAAISRDVPIHEYAPLKIKQAITGNGAASKEQVAAMLGKVLRLDAAESVPFLDATDALAAAYCHYLQTSRPQPAAGASVHSWAAFARANADRVSSGRKGVVNNSDQ